MMDTCFSQYAAVTKLKPCLHRYVVIIVSHDKWYTLNTDISDV